MLLTENMSDAIHKSLGRIHNATYHHRYKAQRHTTGLDMFTMAYSEGYRNRELDYMMRLQTRRFVINYSLVGHSKRNAFRTSEYYGANKSISYVDVAKNYQIFNRGFMIFIDGKFYENGTVVPSESQTILTVDETLLTPSSVVSVIFTPNYRYGFLEVDYNTLQKGKSSLSLPDTVGVVMDSAETYLTFRQDVKSSIQTVSMGADVPHIQDMKFDDRISFNTFGFRHLDRVIEVSDKWFTLDTISPVPKENIIVFKQTDEGLLLTNTNIDMYFSNVYQLVDADDGVYVLYVFYNKEQDPVFSEYDNELTNFLSLLPISLDEYKEGKVPLELLTYVPDELDFNTLDKSPEVDVLTYEINTLKEFVKKHPGTLRHYLELRERDTSSITIPLSSKLLEEKQRFTTLTEFDKYETFYDFVTPHTLLIFKNYNPNSYLNVRFHVDGMLVVETFRWKKGIYEYYYIDEKLLTDKEVVEVEFFNSFHTLKSTTINTLNGVKKIEFSEELSFTRDDIFITEQETNRFLQLEEYELLELKDGKYTSIPDHQYRVIDDNTFYIRVLDKSLVGKTLNIYVSRNAELITHLIKETSMDNEFIFSKKFAAHPEQIRIFKNGHFLTPSIYTLNLPDVFGGITTVHPGLVAYEGDEYVVDVTPNHYHEVFHLRNIPSHGVVSLLGFIDKPLNHQWYDFYVNGKKLPRKDIVFLSPTTVYLRNLTSLRGFFVIEKNRVIEPVQLDNSSTIIVDKLLNMYPNYIEQLGLLAGNQDIDEEIMGELVDMFILELNRLLEFDFPELKILFPIDTEVRPEWINRYRTIFRDTNNLVIFPEGKADMDEDYVLKLFP